MATEMYMCHKNAEVERADSRAGRPPLGDISESVSTALKLG